MYFYIDSHCSFFFLFSNALPKMLRKNASPIILIEAVPLEMSNNFTKKKKREVEKSFSLRQRIRDHVFTFYTIRILIITIIDIINRARCGTD